MSLYSNLSVVENYVVLNNSKKIDALSIIYIYIYIYIYICVYIYIHTHIKFQHTRSVLERAPTLVAYGGFYILIATNKSESWFTFLAEVCVNIFTHTHKQTHTHLHRIMSNGKQ
jgi:hypothetical protein